MCETVFCGHFFIFSGVKAAFHVYLFQKFHEQFVLSRRFFFVHVLASSFLAHKKEFFHAKVFTFTQKITDQQYRNCRMTNKNVTKLKNDCQKKVRSVIFASFFTSTFWLFTRTIFFFFTYRYCNFTEVILQKKFTYTFDFSWGLFNIFPLTLFFFTKVNSKNFTQRSEILT